MKRRDVLQCLGGLGAASLAGCVATRNTGSPPSDDDPDGTADGGTTTSPSNDDTTTTPDDGTGWGPDSETPFEKVTVGDRDGVAFPDNNQPHVVRVWNGATEDRTLALRVERSGESFVDRAVAFPGDGWLKITLNEPGAYELRVGVEGREAETVTVDRTWFDCNFSATNVAVNAEGAVDSTTISTMVACAGPSVAATSFSRGEGNCGTGDEANVAFRDEAVRVTGAVETPNPCYDLTLASATLERAERSADGTDDVLVLAVATDGQREGVCTECVGTVSYEASVAFENEYPSNVRVVHESRGNRRTVREASR